MAGSLNRAQLLGNLGKDPEIRHTQDGKPVVSFSMATSESWRDKASGERKESVAWHSVVIFNEGLAKVAEQYLKKGSKVYIEGAIKTRKWTDNDGNDRYTTEIVLQAYNGQLVLLGDGGGSGRGQADGPEDYGTTTARAETGAKPAGGTYARDLDDEVPF